MTKPTFSFLESYPLKDKYFARTKTWDWQNEKEIYVISAFNDRPAKISMDFWPQEIFLKANGQITVSELIHIIAKQFVDLDLPLDDLDESLIEELEWMANEVKIIEFNDQKTILPVDLAFPTSKSDTVN